MIKKNDNVQTEKEIEHYSKLYSLRYYTKDSETSKNIKYGLKRFARYISPEKYVLDIGGGFGLNCKTLDKISSGKSYIIADISLEGLKKAKSLGFDSILCSATSLPFKNKSIGNFLCINVLEHIVTDDLVIKEISRISTDGGVGLVLTPNTIWDSYPFFFPAHSYQYLLGDHVRTGYNSDELIRKFNSEGSDLLELEYYGYLGTFLAWFVQTLLFDLPLKLLNKRHTKIETFIKNPFRNMFKYIQRIDEYYASDNKHGVAFFWY